MNSWDSLKHDDYYLHIWNKKLLKLYCIDGFVIDFRSYLSDLNFTRKLSSTAVKWKHLIVLKQHLMVLNVFITLQYSMVSA